MREFDPVANVLLPANEPVGKPGFFRKNRIAMSLAEFRGAA